MKITIDKVNASIKDGKITIDLSPEDAKKIIENMNLDNMVPVSSIPVGNTFKIGDEEFIVLDSNYETSEKTTEKYPGYLEGTYTEKLLHVKGVAILRKDFLENCTFGDDSDWVTSPIRVKLNCDYYKEIANIVGENNILKFHRDLTSLDGLDDYVSCEDKISLLSTDEYRKYHKILGLKSDYPNGWWTITPASTPSNDYFNCVCIVSANDLISQDYCYCYDRVRPFLILEPSTLVSQMEER